MIGRGFGAVGWVAAVGSAALGCYLVSLNVASERAELASLEREIVDAKRDIRTLSTELGTRGRMSQLERWNADVLALSAPTSAQYLDNEVMLARFDRREPTIADRAPVRMASAETKPAPVVRDGDYNGAARAAVADPAPKVRQASLTVAKPLDAAVPVRRATLMTGGLVGAIDAAAQREATAEIDGE